MLKNSSPSALLLLLTLLEVLVFLVVFAKIMDLYILILKSDKLSFYKKLQGMPVWFASLARV